MVKKSLINKLKKRINAGASLGDPDDILTCFELIKQISSEVDYLKKDVDESKIICQLILNDVEKYYWIKIFNGKIEYDKGKIKDPSISIYCSKDIGLGIFYGEVDANIVSRVGKLTVIGNLKKLRIFQEIYEDTIYEFKEKYLDH